MKKIFTLICAAALSLGASAQSVNSYDVTKKQDFTDALKSIATLPEGSIAYVTIHGDINVGTLKNAEGEVMAPTLRNIHFVGINDEETGERATLRMEMQLPVNNTETSGFSLHYENLVLCQSQGVWGNSKHLMNFKDKNKHYIDTLEFVNCELTDICRSIYRGEAQNAEADAGLMKVLRMENCTVHNGSRQASAMPLFYLAQPINEIFFKNNTFYDMTYLNSIISFGTMTEATGLKALNLDFINNTICAWSKSSLLNIGSSVLPESDIHIKNNMFLIPDWADDSNNRYGDTNSVHGEMTTSTENPDGENGILSDDEILARIEKGVSVLGYDVVGGYIQLQNNMLFGYKYPKFTDEQMTAIAFVGDRAEEYTDEEESNSLTMEGIPFAWTDFVDAKNDMFQINDQNPAYKAGKNEAPLGDINNYTDKVIKEIALNVKVEGSETVSFSISPAQEKYFSGNTVTITLNDHNNGLRTLNTFKGWSNGSEETTLQIELGEEDIELTATYEPAIENVVSYFDFNQTPAAGQNKLSAYNADVYAPGYEATATCMLRDTATVEGVLSVTSEYHAAAGTENRFNWRSGKFGEDAEDQKVCVLSRKSPAVVRAAETPDYIVFTFSTKDKKGLKFSAFCGTDNFGYKTQLADYSLDGTTWTNFAKVDLESRDAEYSIGEGKLWGWTELAGILPAEAENKDVVYVRVIGDVKGETVTNEVSEIDVETANMFEYVAAVLLTENNSADGIEEIAAEKNASKAAALYNLMGIRVNGNAKGMLIRENKKFIVK